MDQTRMSGAFLAVLIATTPMHTAAQIKVLLDAIKHPGFQAALHKVEPKEVRALPGPAPGWVTPTSLPYYARTSTRCFGFGKIFDPAFSGFPWGDVKHELVGYKVASGLIAMRLHADRDFVYFHPMTGNQLDNLKARVQLELSVDNRFLSGIGKTFVVADLAIAASGIAVSWPLGLSLAVFTILPWAIDEVVESKSTSRNDELLKLYGRFGSEAIALQIVTRLGADEMRQFVRRDWAVFSRDGLSILDRCYYARSP